jgi:hypothetical protein
MSPFRRERECETRHDPPAPTRTGSIAQHNGPDGTWENEAAKRGIFAYIVNGNPSEMQSAIDITIRCYAEYTNLEGAFARRAVIERAKGIMMARQGSGWRSSGATDGRPWNADRGCAETRRAGRLRLPIYGQEQVMRYLEPGKRRRGTDRTFLLWVVAAVLAVAIGTALIVKAW